MVYLLDNPKLEIALFGLHVLLYFEYNFEIILYLIIYFNIFIF